MIMLTRIRNAKADRDFVKKQYLALALAAGAQIVAGVNTSS
jgi:hypothetical protein